jgi:hypothetical protein
MHTELISFTATAPGATGAAAAAVTGDSLIVKNNRGARRPRIIAVWGMQQTSGFQQIAWPSGHDTTRGYRYGVEAGDTSAHLARGLSLPVEAQEVITATIAGSATAGDVELGCLLIHYPDLPGVESRAINFAEVLSRTEKLTTVFATIAGAAAGYTGGELINAESDLLLANRDYAVLGMSTTVDVAAITLVGPDTGYTRVAVPGADQLGFIGQDYFCDLARIHSKPLIPVINSGNRNATTIGILQDENNVNAVVTVYLALLDR